MKFTIGIALLAGIFVNKSLAGGIDVNTSACQVSKVTQQDTFTCPCVGGSGNYDWHFYQLPEGWSSNKGQIVAPKGKFEDKKIYGAKVEVLDKNTKQSVKKSLFFSFENGKVNNIVDYKFDFDIEELVQDAKKPQIINLPVLLPGNSGAANNDINKVKQIFDNVEAIGGGCGLAKVKPYFLGKGGLYKGDSANPYLNKLPTDAQVDAVLATGVVVDVRVLIVNVVRSKVNCKDVNAWLNAILQKLRSKISTSKADVDATEQLIVTVQAQIAALKVELAASQSNVVDINNLTIQVTTLHSTLSEAQNSQSNLQAQLAEVSGTISEYQTQISSVVEQKKQYQDSDDAKVAQINGIDEQIAKLQAEIASLHGKKDALNADRQAISKQIADAQTQIDALNVKINAAKLNVDELNIKIKQAQTLVSTTQTKIDQIQVLIHSGQSTRQTIQSIQAQLSKLQIDLVAAQTKLVKVKAVYQDVNINYEELAKIGDSSFNLCYKTLFNDNYTEIQQDANGHLQFDSKNSLLQYLNKIFNASGNLKNVQVSLNLNNVDTKTTTTTTTTTSTSASTSTSTSTSTGSTTTVNGSGTTSGTTSAGTKITLKQCNVLSKEWTKNYGNPLDKIASNYINGHYFEKDDFACQAPNTLNSYKGKIKSIQNHYAEVVDEKGVACTVYFGGCTRIQTVNKPLPQAGDDLYWLGTRKIGGRSNQFNAHHCTCV